MQPSVLSSAYMPPIQYLTKFILSDVAIEQHENYIKQSFRNRCTILAANGPMSLTIPVVKVHGEKIPIMEVLIDYDLPWQKQHFKSIESAYKNSPYYDYYIDDLRKFFEQRYEKLFELNQQLLDKLLSIIGISKSYTLTSSFERNLANHTDLRNGISPKANHQTYDPHFSSATYYQVFADRYGFTPNLSIIDLLFNEGPLTLSILEKSIKKDGL